MAKSAGNKKMMAAGLRLGVGIVAAFLAGGAVAEHMWRNELRHAHR